MSNNICINALGTITGGDYDSIVVTGCGSCNGSRITAKRIDIPGVMKFTNDKIIQTEAFRCTGVCSLKGNLTTVTANIYGKTTAGQFHADKLEITGQLKVDGDVETAKLDLTGQLSAQGSIKCGEADICGQLKGECLSTGKAEVDGAVIVSGAVEAGAVEVDGLLKANSGEIKSVDADGCIEIKEKLICGKFKGAGVVSAQSLEADSFYQSGSAEIREQLCADKIDITGCIHAKEIVGDQINIGRKYRPFKAVYKGKFGQRKMPDPNVDSEAVLIEATRVELYRVRAKQVNGQDIILGEKCEIDHVDCSGTLSIAPDATVGKITGNYRLV